jgi:hypothetical protein
MQSKRPKKKGATPPVVNKPSDEDEDIRARARLFPSLTKEHLEADAAFAEYLYQEYGHPNAEDRRKSLERWEKATPAERAAYAKLVASIFRTDEEDDAAIQADMEEDPEGENGIPLEQANAEMDRQIKEWEAEAKRKLRNK